MRFSLFLLFVGFWASMNSPLNATTPKRLSCEQWQQYGQSYEPIGLTSGSFKRLEFYEKKYSQNFGVGITSLSNSDFANLISALKTCISKADKFGAIYLKPAMDNMQKEGEIRTELINERNEAYRSFMTAFKAQKNSWIALTNTPDELSAEAEIVKHAKMVLKAGETVSQYFQILPVFKDTEINQAVEESRTIYDSVYALIEEKNAKLNQIKADQKQSDFAAIASQAATKHATQISQLQIPQEILDGNFYLRNLNTGASKPWLSIRQWLGLLYEKDPAINIDIWTLEGSPAIGIGVKKPGRPRGTFYFLEDAGDVFLTYFGKDGQVYELTYQRDMGSINALMIRLAQ